MKHMDQTIRAKPWYVMFVGNKQLDNETKIVRKTAENPQEEIRQPANTVGGEE